MKLVSKEFLAAVTSSQSFVRRVDLWQNGQPQILDLPVVDGEVTLDGTAAIMGRCTVRIADESLIPKLALDPLTPFGNELHIWRGVRLSTGDELVSLGFYGISSVDVTDPEKTVQITGWDRSKWVQEANLLNPFVVDAGTNYSTAIRRVIEEGVFGLTYNFADIGYGAPLLVFPDGEDGARWKAAQQMATSAGYQVFFDGNGVTTLRREPSLSSPPVITLTDGEGGVVMSAPVSWDRAQAYNAVVVTSSGPDVNPPIHQVVINDDASSKTYFYGSFRQKPRRYASPFITTDQQAIDAGRGILAREEGVVQSVSLMISPNPALEPGDVIYIKRPSLGVNQVSIIDSVRIGLTADDSMQIKVRSRGAQ